jgi:hypothetical protein
MKFVYPEFLWAFGVLAIPIIIHLFNFRKYKTLYFSSLKFIQFVDQQTRSTQKLKHLLILIARILAFSFLILAFAQPFIPATSNNSKGGKPVIAIYIDNSFSMSMKGTEGEMISEAREMARKMIQEASLDTRFMLVTNALSGIEERIVSKLDALERLDKIEIIPLVRNIADVIEWEKNAISREHETNLKIGTKQFVVFSDFQKNSSDLSHLKADNESFYFPVKLTPQDESNIFIDSVWFTSPVQKIGETNELNIQVKNISKNDLTNVELHVEIGNIKRDVFLDITANDKVHTTINYTEQKDGFKQGKVSVNDKQFFSDDEYFFSYHVSKNSNILIINGENAVKNISLVYSLDNFYSVNEVEQNSFTSDVLANKDLVIINGSKEIPSGLAEELVNYTENGGSLALFPGEDINPSESGWNSFLRSLKMTTLGSTFNEGVKIKNINFEDPFFKSVFEKNPQNLNLPTVAKAYKANTFTSTQAIGLINLQNGSPLYVKSLGASNVFLYTSSLSPAFGSFTSNALFSTILLRTAELSKKRTPISIIIGDETKFPVYSNSKSESPIRLKNKETDFIPSVFEKGAISYLSLSGLEAIEVLKSGTYEIIDDQVEGLISLNYNRKESEISSYTLSEISTLFENQGIKHITLSEISEGQSLTKIDLEKPHEYWKLFLIFALLFLLAEMALLKFWKK